MARHNERKLSLIYDKREKDFVVKYPRRCDGALIMNTLVNDRMIWCVTSEDNPRNWVMENISEELEKRGYDLTTIKFSIELKKESLTAGQ